MRYQFIKEHQDLYGIGLMCRLLKVSSSGYYNWRQRVVSKREMANRKLFEPIYRIFHENRQVYGPIRVWKALKKGEDIDTLNQVNIQEAKRGKYKIFVFTSFVNDY
ncbi:MAG: putative transposase [Cellvibrionaceae bacterium]|jgi:putative transposase